MTAVLFVLTIGLPAQAAKPAAEVTGGTLSWGVKASFRNYVTGPIAHGEVTAIAPATKAGDRIEFAGAGGSWSDGDASVRTAGKVRFTGHDGVLDLTLAAPRISVSGAKAQLIVDAVDSDGREHSGLAIADLDLSGAVAERGAEVTITNAAATLTAAGTAVFSYNGSPMYPAGTALDPVSARLSVHVEEPEPTPSPSETSTPTETPSPSVTPTPSETPTPTGTPTSTQSPKPTAEPKPTRAPARAGTLTWGVKASFRSYVTGPIAQGAVSVSRGASAVSGGYRFGQSATTADVPSATGTTSYRGTVRFSGHHGVLNLAFSDPRIKVASASVAELSVAVSGRGRVTLATLALASGSRSSGSGTVSYSGVPARLTAAGAAVFSYSGSNFYPAGTQLDPVSFVIGGRAATSNAGETRVSSATSPAATPTATATPSATPSVLPVVTGCALSDAELTWGFKESFRAYISGSIANGDWQTDGAVGYRTPVFTWNAGSGTSDPASGAGELVFTGTVRFTGHDGALDTTIADPVVRFGDSGTATLALDYGGTTMDEAISGSGRRVESADVPFVDLAVAAGELSRDGERVTITGIPARLTSQGSAAFPNYPAGTAFDPVTLSYTEAPDCAAAEAVPSVPPAAATSAEPPADAPGAGGWLGWAASSAAGAVFGSAITLLVARRWLVKS